MILNFSVFNFRTYSHVCTNEVRKLYKVDIVKQILVYKHGAELRRWLGKYFDVFTRTYVDQHSLNHDIVQLNTPVQ